MTAMETVQAALTAKGCQGHGSAWTCPAHEDKIASLSVNPAAQFAGVVLHCHGGTGCEKDAILDSLGLTERDLFDEPLQRKTGPEIRYDYLDEDGVLLYQKERYQPKSFQQRRPSAGGWTWKLGDVRRVLYNLPEVARARDNRTTLYYVEGEKDCLTLIGQGKVATTAGGVQDWRPEYAQYFAGLDVIIIADNDAPGIPHAKTVLAAITAVAKSAVIMVSPYGKDVTDHIQSGHGLDELVPLNQGVDNINTLPPSSGNPLLNTDGSVNWTAAFEATSDKIEWIIEPFIEKGMTHSLYGIPGHGKSLFVMQSVVHHVIPHHHVLYVDNENHLTRVVTKRLKSFGMTPDGLGSLHFYSFTSLPGLDTPQGGAEILRLAQLHHASLVVIDTTSRFVQGPEDKADTFTAFYNYTMMPLKREDIASLRLDHPGKDISRGTRGSSAKLGDVDYEFSIEDNGGMYRKLTCTKGRTENISKSVAILLRKHGITENNDRFWHEWVYDAAQAAVSDDTAVLDSLGLAPDAGRDKVKTALAAAGIPMSGPRMQAAIRARKT